LPLKAPDAANPPTVPTAAIPASAAMSFASGLIPLSLSTV